MVSEPILRTTVVGSYPQPDWLLDKRILRGQLVPRVRTESLWLVPPQLRAEALKDAACLAIRGMEEAGIDVITDGETSRESYSNHFVAALAGLDVDHPATIVSRIGIETRVPRVTGPIRHVTPIEQAGAIFLRENTTRRAKVTLPGPFTLSQLAKDEHYHDAEAMAFAFAEALNVEAKALESTGIDVIQLDEPWLRNDPEAARRYGVRTIERALEGLKVRTAVHMCFGYAFLKRGQKTGTYELLGELAASRVDEISIEAAQPSLDLGILRDINRKTIALGVLDHSTQEPEPVEVVAQRIRAGLAYLPPERLMPAPDCGMKYMTREDAFKRLQTLAQAAALVRRELT